MVRTGLATLAAVAALMVAPAHAEFSGGALKIVVMNDQSSVYSDSAGTGSVVAAQLAVEDVGGKVAGVPIQVTGADHQQKVDIGVSLAKRMIDVDGADAFFDISNSAVSLAVQEITRQANKIVVHVGSANVDLVGKACSPTGALWLYDTYGLAHGLAEALLDDQHKRWFLVVADYAFGHAMQRDMSATLEKGGGKVVGAVRHPLATPDFSSFLLQASGSEPQVIAMLNAGIDTANAAKQAAEFGMMKKGVKLALPIFTIRDAKAIGTTIAQGSVFLSGYDWNYDDESRAFAKRYQARTGHPPTHVQAGTYSAVRHYLKAVEATKSDAGDVVMKKMKEMPVEDFMTKGATLRPDGRLERAMLLTEVKAPAEVTGEWDILKVLKVVPGTDMVKPLAQTECPLLRKP